MWRRRRLRPVEGSHKGLVDPSPRPSPPNSVGSKIRTFFGGEGEEFTLSELQALMRAQERKRAFHHQLEQ